MSKAPKRSVPNLATLSLPFLWPVAVGAACAFGAIAITFWSVWLLVLAGAVILFTVGGFVFEYHIGASRQE